MSPSNNLRSGTAAALTALAVAIGASVSVPIVTPTPALAQYESQYRATIPVGTRLPVQYDKNKIVVTPTETSPLTLRLATDVVSRNGTVLIPAGTQVVGQLQPATRGGVRGSQFVASELVFSNGQQQSIDASSGVVTRTQTVKKGASTGTLLTGAAVGAGAASVLTAVTGGGFKIPATLGGAAAGVVGGLLFGKKQTTVVVIYPNNGDLNVRLNSSLALR
jgi:hypothetical protein